MPKSPCAHLERQPDSSLSGVLSARIRNRHRDAQLDLVEVVSLCAISRALTKIP